MSDELVRLVEGEKRGADAIAMLSVVTLLALAILVTRMLGYAGYPLFFAAAGCFAMWAIKRRALARVLHRRNEIESVDRIRWLGRPAVKIVFLDGGAITLPTWNQDRERVMAALEKRELPPARLLE